MTIVFPFLLIAVIFFLAMIAAKISSKIYVFMTWKRSEILAGVYLGILLLLVPILNALPKNDFLKTDSSESSNMSQSSTPDLFNLMAKGDLDQLQGVYKNNTQTFKVDQPTLKFDLPPNSGYNQIFIERKGVDDGEIEVRTYVATQFTEGIDFTKLILPPKVSFQNGVLALKSEQQKLDFKLFKTDFTVGQFKPEDMINIGRMSMYFGWKAVYVRVPKSLEIDQGKYHVQIIGEPK